MRGWEVQDSPYGSWVEGGSNKPISPHQTVWHQKVQKLQSLYGI